MQALTKIENDIVIVALNGRVDVETAEPFRAACVRELRGKKVVFDFSKLSFVGSQGILPFLETMQTLHELAPGSFKFSGVGIEFRKVFAATPLNVVEFHETVSQALGAFALPPTLAVAVQAAPVDSYLSYRPEPLGGGSPTSASPLSDEADV